MQAQLGESGIAATVLAQADSIAWLFNLRGADIAHNPVALAYAVVPANGKPTLFIDGRKLSNSVRSALADLAEIKETRAIGADLAALGDRRHDPPRPERNARGDRGDHPRRRRDRHGRQ